MTPVETRSPPSELFGLPIMDEFREKCIKKIEAVVFSEKIVEKMFPDILFLH